MDRIGSVMQFGFYIVGSLCFLIGSLIGYLCAKTG
jgi:hypothetical protein